MKIYTENLRLLSIYFFIDFLHKKEYNLDIKIFLKIDNLITEQHRSLKSFCTNTNRSYSSLARTMSETIYNGKGAHLVTTEEILNDLGYELTIQKKRKEV